MNAKRGAMKVSHWEFKPQIQSLSLSRWRLVSVWKLKAFFFSIVDYFLIFFFIKNFVYVLVSPEADGDVVPND